MLLTIILLFTLSSIRQHDIVNMGKCAHLTAANAMAAVAAGVAVGSTFHCCTKSWFTTDMQQKHRCL